MNLLLWQACGPGSQGQAWRSWPWPASAATTHLQSGCRSAGGDGQDASTPIIGREGLLRLAGLAGRLRARDLAEADTPWTVKGICPPDPGSSAVLATRGAGERVAAIVPESVIEALRAAEDSEDAGRG
jgi:hypothetical protein